MTDYHFSRNPSKGFLETKSYSGLQYGPFSQPWASDLANRMRDSKLSILPKEVTMDKPLKNDFNTIPLFPQTASNEMPTMVTLSCTLHGFYLVLRYDFFKYIAKEFKLESDIAMSR